MCQPKEFQPVEGVFKYGNAQAEVLDDSSDESEEEEEYTGPPFTGWTEYWIERRERARAIWDEIRRSSSDSEEEEDSESTAKKPKLDPQPDTPKKDDDDNGATGVPV